MSEAASRPLVLVSNRGPVTFQEDGEVKRGTGGLVTALTGLASHRDAVWIASALTDGDAKKADEADGAPFTVRSPAGGEYQVRLVVSDPQAYDRFYNIFANPMLWFIQHYLWDLSNAPDVRRHEVQAYEDGYCAVNQDLARAVLDEVEGEDEEAGFVKFDGRDVWVRSYPLPISAETFERTAQRPAVHQYEREILRRRREHLILRVDRADLSKNVLRGFTAFDLFLEQHPEFREEVTFIAHLIPSRMDVPEYAEYMERIEALVAVVDHRHGTTDWMPIELRLRENLEEAIAAYKHYDLLLVNAMFDGMNLIAKEVPLVNERHGVSLLSENTGAHEELADFALSVNPFDVQEQADAIHRALTMSAEERSWRAQGQKRIVTARDPGDWVDDQLADIERKREARAADPA